MKRNASPPDYGYLIQEGLLFLGLSYLLLLGGTFNGLVLYELNLTNAFLLTGGIGLWLVWRSIRQRPFPGSPLDLAILALTLSMLLATILSSDPRRSAIALGQLLVYISLFYLVLDFLRSGMPAELVVKVMLLVSGFVLFFGLWEIQRWFQEWISIAGWSDPIPPATLRVRAFLGHPNFVAAFFALLLPIGMARWLESSMRSSRIILALWVLLALSVLFFTSSRGGWLGAGAGVLTFLVGVGLDRKDNLRMWWVKFRQRPWLLGVLGMTAIALGAFGSFLLSRQSSHPTHASGLSSRSGIWGVALRSFQRHILTGRGPFTYGTAFIEDHSVPPGMLLAHAHSYLLNTAAEMGLIGLVVIAIFVTALLKLAWRLLRNRSQEKRTAQVGLLAGLVAFSVHSLFDTPTTFPALAVFVGVILALLSQEGRPQRRSWENKLGTYSLIGVWAILSGGLAFNIWSYRPHIEGVFASNTGDWNESAQKIALAAERDPTLAFYWFQSAFAEGMTDLRGESTMENLASIELAIERYQRGLALEPSFGTNWANLGILLWVDGEEEQSVQALEKAVDLAPREAAFWVTLGRMYEAADQRDRAVKAYRKALDLRPYWSHSYYFRATSMRVETVEVWREGKVIPPIGDSSAYGEGWTLLAAGGSQEAAQYFRSQLGLNTPEAYYGLGRALIDQGLYKEALENLRIARFLPSRDGWMRAMIDLSMGEAYRRMGRCEQALGPYQHGLAALDATTSLGVGMLGISDYGWYVFNRASIAADLLPGVEYLRYTDPVAADMLGAADCYRALGQVSEAEDLTARAYQTTPDLDAVMEQEGDDLY